MNENQGKFPIAAIFQLYRGGENRSTGVHG
jgi:hypothetical protein